jgi:hypothetical protein
MGETFGRSSRRVDVVQGRLAVGLPASSTLSGLSGSVAAVEECAGFLLSLSPQQYASKIMYASSC